MSLCMYKTCTHVKHIISLHAQGMSILRNEAKIVNNYDDVSWLHKLIKYKLYGSCRHKCTRLIFSHKHTFIILFYG